MLFWFPDLSFLGFLLCVVGLGFRLRAELDIIFLWIVVIGLCVSRLCGDYCRLGLYYACQGVLYFVICGLPTLSLQLLWAPKLLGFCSRFVVVGFGYYDTLGCGVVFRFVGGVCLTILIYIVVYYCFDGVLLVFGFTLVEV